jgi:hypothetical protein
LGTSLLVTRKLPTGLAADTAAYAQIAIAKIFSPLFIVFDCIPGAAHKHVWLAQVQ